MRLTGVLKTLTVALGLAAVVAQPVPGQKLKDVVNGIELRYNSMATMQADFSQDLVYAGSQRMHETGLLRLLRPQRMRWDYSSPEGKLIVGEGDFIKMFNPLTNQVRTVEMSPTADMTAPLAFLLGRVRFNRQFRNLRLETIDGEAALVADGLKGTESYRWVEFYYSPDDFRLKRIKVTGRDDSVTDFRFWNEKRNPRLDEPLFVFQSPAGAELLPVTRLGEK